eukprot:2691752-Pleurochrysis_carterae.AAC.1
MRCPRNVQQNQCAVAASLQLGNLSNTHADLARRAELKTTQLAVNLQSEREKSAMSILKNIHAITP